MSSFLECLPRGVRDRVRRIGALADEKGVKVALVGGVVRDILLGSGSFDIDLVVEGDAIALATACQKAWGGRLTVHRRFGTATFEGEGGFKCDLATAREESYRRPAVLPDVRPGRLEADLARRDITINAMAYGLSAGVKGTLLDPFGGQEDLTRRAIRVLHDKSFVDDPTRILRVIRFEQRLKFRLESRTLALLRGA
jgi:tRNA nucleotidyltransferase (CCA-adding enzyme)